MESEGSRYSKDFDGWNVLKKRIENRRETFCNPREIWWCSIGANIGTETSGKNGLFERPVLILRVYNTRSVVAIPITSVPKDDQFHHRIAYGNSVGWLILSHARTISPKRLQRKLYRISSHEFSEIVAALCNLIVNNGEKYQ